MSKKEGIIISAAIGRFCVSAIAVSFFCACALAEPMSQDSTSPEKKIDISGYGGIEAGEIEAGHYGGNLNSEIFHLWIGHAYAGLSVRSRLNDHFSVLLSLESRIWYNTSPISAVRDNSTFGAPMQNFDITITNAEGILSFGNKEIFGLSIGMGRFEYKYNPQSQDLGEYLFRTGCYPTYIRTTFDLSLARLNGILASFMLFDCFRQDLLVTTMSDIEPFYNFNFAYVADVSIGKVFDVGAGISFDNVLPVDQTNDIQTSVHDYATNGYLNAPGDTGYYSYQGIKAMVRLAFDPKRFFNFAPFFGEKDGVIYAEAAVLGLIDYPRSNVVFDSATSANINNICNIYGYDKIFQKMPITFGFNWPTHPFLSYGLIPVAIALSDIGTFEKNPVLLGGTGILSGIIAGGGTWLLEKYAKAHLRLDVLSVEGEWFGSRYPDSYSNYLGGLSSAPTNPGANEVPYDYAHDDWKWAIYAKKTMLGGLSFIGLVGRDHLRTETFIKKFQDYEATLIKNNHWYWMFKINSSF
jgi:hypothetical protein